MDAQKDHIIAILGIVAQELRDLRKIWRGREPATENKIDTIVSEGAGLIDELAGFPEATLEPLIASDIMVISEDLDAAADGARDQHLGDALRVQSGRLKQMLFSIGVAMGSDGRFVFTDPSDKTR